MTISTTGVITEIERFAVNDGPGIRTVVFFKGCPLKCLWCANPETKSKDVQLMYWATRCIGCKRCISACPERSLSWKDKVVIDRNSCTLCGKCAEMCNCDALTKVGDKKSVDEVIQYVLRDKPFYDKSGGGITFSGGEAMYQLPFLVALAKEAKIVGLNTAMETSGFFSWSSIEQTLPYIDVYLYDVKHMDNDRHKALCGVDNTIVHDNLRRLRSANKEIHIRMPVLPGINTDTNNLEAMANFLLQTCPGCRVGLLPYHRLGVSKYERLNEMYTLPEVAPPTEECMDNIASFFRDKGFNVRIGE